MNSNGGKYLRTIHSDILDEHSTETQQGIKLIARRHTEMWSEETGVSEGHFKWKLSVSCHPNQPFKCASVHLFIRETFVECLLQDESGAQGRNPGKGPKPGRILPGSWRTRWAYLGKEQVEKRLGHSNGLGIRKMRNSKQRRLEKEGKWEMS